MKRNLLAGWIAAVLAVVLGCGGGAPEGGGPPRNAPRARIVPPQVLFQAQPDLSEADAEAIWATPGTIRAAIAINVGRDGVASNPRIVATEPKDLPVSRAFAEAVIRSLPNWRFQPATRDGVPVDAETTIAMEAEGGQEETPPR